MGRIAYQMREYSFLSRVALSRSLDQGLLLDQIRRDIVVASANLSHWDPKKFVFRQEVLSIKNMLRRKRPNLSKLSIIKKDVGFEIRKGGLFRLEGEYDYARNIWLSKKRASKLFSGKKIILGLKLSCVKNYVSGVTIYLGKKSFYVRVRNGVL